MPCSYRPLLTVSSHFFTARFAQGAENAKGELFAGMRRKRSFRQNPQPWG